MPIWPCGIWPCGACIPMPKPMPPDAWPCAAPNCGWPPAGQPEPAAPPMPPPDQAMPWPGKAPCMAPIMGCCCCCCCGCCCMGIMPGLIAAMPPPAIPAGGWLDWKALKSAKPPCAPGAEAAAGCGAAAGAAAAGPAAEKLPKGSKAGCCGPGAPPTDGCASSMLNRSAFADAAAGVDVATAAAPPPPPPPPWLDCGGGPRTTGPCELPGAAKRGTKPPTSLG
mmetsp:Transcript_76120/g.226879  ORF Transcript_76120/g.226879 Transcript_76120/m.226879 type:complete len:223 (-) Transcript_76120:680-1348(-)